MDRSACGNWQRVTLWRVGVPDDGRAKTTTASSTTASSTATAAGAKTETGSATTTATSATTTGTQSGADDYSG